jgi:ABC-2 type transport system ATP-binding protein
MSDAYLSFDHVTKQFGATIALDDLSFDVPAGRVVGLLGPNGAGKSTALRILTGLVRPTAGSARVRGKRLAQLAHPAREVGVALESLRCHPGRSGRDHLLVQALTGGVAYRQVEEVLALVGLEGAAHRRVGTYSLGMRQRLNLAGALLGNPGALVLDEPANGLDPEGVRWLRDFLRGLATEGRAVLVSSHGLAEMEHTADVFVILAHGRLKAVGRLDEIAARTGTDGRSGPGNGPLLEEAFLQLIAPEGPAARTREAPREAPRGEGTVGEGRPR